MWRWFRFSYVVLYSNDLLAQILHKKICEILAKLKYQLHHDVEKEHLLQKLQHTMFLTKAQPINYQVEFKSRGVWLHHVIWSFFVVKILSQLAKKNQNFNQIPTKFWEIFSSQMPNSSNGLWMASKTVSLDHSSHVQMLHRTVQQNICIALRKRYGKSWNHLLTPWNKVEAKMAWPSSVAQNLFEGLKIKDLEEQVEKSK